MASTSHLDVEKAQAQATHATPPSQRSSLVHQQPGVATQQDHAPALTTYLETYQELIGIRSYRKISQIDDDADHPMIATAPTSKDGIHNGKQNGRPRKKLTTLLYNSYTSNEGLYQRALNEELKASIGYGFSSFIITTIYLLQILVAATITALAAYEGHRVAVTVLGAINTVLAGLTAYVKGMGLPNRLRKSRDQFHHIREYAEYKERQFSKYDKLGGLKTEPGISALDPWIEAEVVRKMYNAAKKDQQDNYPDLYINNNEREQMQSMSLADRGGVGSQFKVGQAGFSVPAGQARAQVEVDEHH